MKEILKNFAFVRGKKKRKYILLSYRDTRNGKKGYLLRLWGSGGNDFCCYFFLPLFSTSKTKKKDNSLGSTRKLYKKKKKTIYIFHLNKSFNE